MSPGRIAVISLAAVAVIVALVVGGGGNSSGNGAATSTAGGPPDAPPSGALVVDFVYSPEKEPLVADQIKAFNAQGTKAGGQTVFVKGQIVASGDAQRRIAKGTLKPAIWSPASSLWGRLLNYEADKPYVPDENPSIARTPLVIAMWEPLARALGYPKQPIGFKKVLELAQDPQGLAKLGRPEYGTFRLGHTNPDFSTSGLSAVAAEYYSAIGKREGLTVEDVNAAKVRDEIRAIERSIVHYGDTTLFFSDQLKRYGPAYASAVAMEEATLVDFNRTRGKATKLVGIYPSEGTFFSDNPLIVPNAPWVTPQLKHAADAFVTFLTERVTPAVAAQAGFRPGDPDVKALAPVDASNGANPALPTRVLSLPRPEVLARVKAAWREDRKPANVMLAVDVSGSMSEEGKLEQAKEGLKGFFRQLSPRDRVGLVFFNDKVFPGLPVQTFASGKAKLMSTVRDLLPGGETAWLDATDAAVKKIQALKDSTRINAVVLLTDGADTASRVAPETLRRVLDGQARSEGSTVRVYTIAYGRDANKSALEAVAKASGGKAFTGDPKQIESVYLSISSFF
ncbi:MAG: von Willebrand factor type [Solirubrobacterales bacterium]|nr:von Willebrand factor type [Solirubrobacterales bacterium]